MDRDAPSIGRLENGEHLLGLRVYYEDTDFTGVVYHANYLRYFERGRSEYLRVMGVPEDREDFGAFAIVRAEIDFKAPARIHDVLLMRTSFLGLKGPRLFFGQVIERDGQVLCRAHITAVAIHADGRPRRPSQAEITLWDRHKKA
jgi:acyl-CoA thioester hydrolase